MGPKNDQNSGPLAALIIYDFLSFIWFSLHSAFWSALQVLVYFSSKPMFPLVLLLPEKGPIPKWTIYKHVSDKNKKCMSVGNFGWNSVCCLWSVVYGVCSL